MPKIDFYILNDTSPQARFAFTFRLLEKAYQHNHRVYVHTASKQEATQLDDFLWTFREDSFLPHYLYEEPLPLSPPIHIGCGQTPKDHSDILLNLTRDIPPFYTQFNRVLEIIPQDNEWRTLARKNYKLYREQGFELQTYDMSQTKK